MDMLLAAKNCLKTIFSGVILKMKQLIFLWRGSTFVTRYSYLKRTGYFRKENDGWLASKAAMLPIFHFNLKTLKHLNRRIIQKTCTLFTSSSGCHKNFPIFLLIAKLNTKYEKIHLDYCCLLFFTSLEPM